MVARVRFSGGAAAPDDQLGHVLTGRLKVLDEQLADLARERETLQEQRDLTARLLDIERARTGFSVLKEKRSIAEIVNSALLRGVSSKGQIRAIATKEGHTGVGRSVNAVLMGYMRHNIVEETGDENFELTEKGKEVLSAKAEDLPGLRG